MKGRNIQAKKIFFWGSFSNWAWLLRLLCSMEHNTVCTSVCIQSHVVVLITRSNMIIFQVPNFGFVVFDEMSSVEKAMQSQPIMLYGTHRFFCFFFVSQTVKKFFFIISTTKQSKLSQFKLSFIIVYNHTTKNPYLKKNKFFFTHVVSSTITSLLLTKKIPNFMNNDKTSYVTYILG